MPENKKISRRDAEIECIELDKKYFKGVPSKFQKIRKFFRMPQNGKR